MGPTILKVSLIFTGVSKNLEHHLRNELWARRQTSILSDRRALENFFGVVMKLLATLVALHFTLVSKQVSK